MGYYMKNLLKVQNIIIFVAVVAAVVALIIGINFLTDKPYYNISAEQLEEMLQLSDGDFYGEEDIADFQFVDIRTEAEYNGTAIGSIVHIPEFTINLDFYAFREDLILLDQLNKQKPVVLICNSGNRSAEASGLLMDYGFKKVYNVEGGIQAYDALTSEEE